MDEDKFQSLRKLANEVMNERDSTAEINPTTLAEAIHELEVQQIELELQYGELVQSHDELSTSREQYENIFEFAPIGYITTNSDDIIQHANQEANTLLTNGDRQIIGYKFNTFVATDDQDAYYLHRRNAMQQESTKTIDVTLKRRDQTEFYARLNSFKLSRDGQLWLTAIIDITQFKVAQEVLQQAVEKEKELHQLKSRLIEVISHELRTPLTTIMSSLDILELHDDKLDGEKRQEHFDRIRHYLWYLTDIVQDTLIVQRSDEDASDLSISEFDVIAFIQQTVNDVTQLHRGQSIQFIFNLKNQSNTLIINFDKHLLRKILLNLLQNAVKYSDDDVECTLTATDDTFTLEVRDYGVGIPEKDREHIFDIFYRGENTRFITGTGIGLHVVKLAVERSRGTIQVYSSPQGTTFLVNLPRTLTDTM